MQHSWVLASAMQGMNVSTGNNSVRLSSGPFDSMSGARATVEGGQFMAMTEPRAVESRAVIFTLVSNGRVKRQNSKSRLMAVLGSTAVGVAASATDQVGSSLCL